MNCTFFFTEFYFCLQGAENSDPWNTDAPPIKHELFCGLYIQNVCLYRCCKKRVIMLESLKVSPAHVRPDSQMRTEKDKKYIRKVYIVKTLMWTLRLQARLFSR